jgi:hypothetical protein
LEPVEIVEVWSELFRRSGSDETISACDETIFRLPRRTAETAKGYEASPDPRSRAREIRLMHIVRFVLAFALTLAAPSMAGSGQGSLPGIGTFAYGGAPATPGVMVAVR